jgi:Protein of unknown function (DUF5672)
MLNLSNITLLCVETRDPELAHWAIDHCTRQAQFGKVVLLSDLERLHQRRADIDYFQAPPIKTTKDYSSLLLTGIRQYVDGTHVLIIQWDSFITSPELWSDEFLAYDYIGPVWPHHPQTPVGNGGFSLRSVQLLDALLDAEMILRHPEDYCICVDNKALLEQKHHIQFAPVAIAEQFAVERSLWHPAFGFHGFFNFGRVLNDAQLREFIALLPEGYLSGLDSYDLIAQLQEQGRNQIAKEIGRKVHFRWKMRKRYIKLKFWLIFN